MQATADTTAADTAHATDPPAAPAPASEPALGRWREGLYGPAGPRAAGPVLQQAAELVGDTRSNIVPLLLGLRALHGLLTASRMQARVSPQEIAALVSPLVDHAHQATHNVRVLGELLEEAAEALPR